MESFEILQEGSKRLGLPAETGDELIRLLMVQKYSGIVGESFYPSTTLERLLRFVLLNTHVRSVVEEHIGKINCAEPGSPLDNDALMKRRHVLASFLLSDPS